MALQDVVRRELVSNQASLNGDEEEEGSLEVILSVLAQRGQVGLCFYDSKDSTLHYMADTPDDTELTLLERVIQEISPHVIITSAKQEHSMVRFMNRLGSNPDYKPEVVTYPYVDFGVVYVDRDTYSVLQIFKSELHPSVYKLQSGQKEGLSLYGILNRCKCKFGSRLLRRWFLRPTRDMAVLHRRQEAIRFFASPRNSDTAGTLQSLLRNIRSIPVDFDSSSTDSRFTIKSNVDPAIDEKKRTMMGLSDFLTDVARKELEHLDNCFPSCCVIYIPLIGFLLSVPRLPSMVKKEDFEIVGLDFMMYVVVTFLSDMETAVMIQLQTAILEKSSSLYKVLELSAELDCLMAMSSASQEYGYTSPKLAAHNRILLTQARHPLLELCSPVFVANSFQSSESQGRVKVITGPNSSGKSIYLKQVEEIHSKLTISDLVGLAVFMALIGSDVPAKEAEIGLVDGIFTRMQSRESVSVGLSTFMIDLNQTLETAVDEDELVFLYQLKEGICQSSYAANIAMLAGLPTSVVQRGVEVSELYRTGKTIKRIDRPSLDEQTNRCNWLVEKFLSVDLNNKDVNLQNFLKEELLPSAGDLL
ncbi:MutS 5 [Merluccius polli]|uniref:MutS 5 n=1 Tax=Merluccius polli TaxID=89951 RepID=A0AA47P5Y2_MERPO|nr:MutS 5 [Merluccius polli]